ncbi:metallophosphoesterase-domain-containing protein [Aquicoccus porphyridii]|uniref:Metallophosphoesterase-domain-containing protein n=1 Tax=Aquicoccus porphyridii TaxID=1852029 RepID=A0A5A9ZGC8_9RHOB|nr:metallophosphoesterase [Aquicoccus porphyridii]KAA0916096.1 metallophosphoesterase-domain-containing protein [Aquicoccus porphyridii]RAI52735.1 metallophosphoesterase-domain-containing protein [Rhodobacteraceae bacterium AsT-22]
MTLRLAIVADIHHGQPSATKRGDTALGLMEEFARYVHDAAVTHVLDLGDRISDADQDTDLRLQTEVAEAFRAVDKPIWHLNGNHDRDHLSVAQNEEILGQGLGHETHDIDGWRIALWRADSRIYRGADHSGFVLREADLLWLSRTAQAADRPLLVVSHVPLSGHSQIGNYYFQNNPGHATYPMAERARAALAQARVPVVCLAGHVHWNTVNTVDGIPHLTQQSLTESFTNGGEPAGAMGVIELGDTIHWQVAGEDPFRAELHPTAQRWTPALPEFHAHPELRARHSQSKG